MTEADRDQADREQADREQVAEVGQKAGRGLKWSLLGNLANKAGNFAVSLVLARMLVPEDYGHFAIAFAASQFLIHINDAGIIAAIVQWRGKLEDLAPTATIMAFGFSSLVYLVFFGLAPVYSELSGSADATGVVRILTATILVDGITAVRAGKLMRDFRQDLLIVANFAGLLASGSLTIALAAGGQGAYSFAWGQLAGSIVTGAFVLYLGRVPFVLRLDRPAVKHLIAFGVPLGISLGIEGLMLNVDKMIIGHWLGPVALGFYLIAFNVSSWMPGIIGTAVRWVSLPSFSRLAEQGGATLDLGVRKATVTVTAFVLPFMLVMSLLASQVVVVLYGQRWEPAGAALRFLALVMIVRLLLPLAFDILTALGATRWTVVLNAGWFAALIPALLIGARYGIDGASMGQAAAGLGVTLPLAAFALHRAGVRVAALAGPLTRPVFAAVAAGLVMIGLDEVIDGPALLELLVAGGAGTVLYVLLIVPTLKELRS